MSASEWSGRGALRTLLLLNGAMFVVEASVGLAVESMGLVADGLDMGADAVVYGLAFLAAGGAATAKLRAARLAGWAQLGLAALAIGEVGRRITSGSDPDPTWMIGVSLLALVVNVVCLLVLRRHRDGEVHLQAAWIFSSTDAQANLGVIAAGGLVALTGSGTPDLVIGLIVALLVLRGALRIRQRVAMSAALVS